MTARAEAGCDPPLPALRLQPELAEYWLPKILACEYDPRTIGDRHKAGVTLGMAMTENRAAPMWANTTGPTRSPPGQAYELVGLRFCSAPMRCLPYPGTNQNAAAPPPG